MSPLTRTALVTAVALSAFAVVDAVARAVTSSPLPWDFDQEQPWIGSPWGIVGAALHAVPYLALAGVLLVHAVTVDGRSRMRRWTRRSLVSALVVVALGHLLALVTGVSAVVAGLVGGGFALVFLASVILGISLLRRRPMRTPAVLLAAGLPASFAAVFVLDAIAPAWAHPAYPEAVAYVGLALIGWAAEGHGSDSPTAGLAAPATA